MRWRRPTEATDDGWTMEGFEALQAVDQSQRKVWIGVVGSPAAAWLWAHTIEMSRAFEAGRLSPRHGAGLSELVWFYFSMGVEGLIGRTGLHVAFACIVAIVVSVGLWGSVQRRDLDRRGVTTRALRHVRATRRRWLRTAMEGESEPEGSGPTRANGRALSMLLQLVLLGRKALPLAFIALTAFFAWRALAR